MSRIGKASITIPANVTVTIANSTVTVVGPLGTLSRPIPFKINVEVKDGIVYVSRVSEDKKVKANHGTTRALINNMISGVVTPFKKEMEIRGTGYKFALKGTDLVVTAGYINPVNMPIPAGIQCVVADDTKLTITGSNKEMVGQLASNIRKIRKPEPYKGKGIRYATEFIKLKAGKTAKA